MEIHRHEWAISEWEYGYYNSDGLFRKQSQEISEIKRATKLICMICRKAQKI